MSRTRFASVAVTALEITAVLTAILLVHPAYASWSGESSRLGGTGRIDAGEWIWQDFVFDDYGADTAGGDQIVLLASTSGDFRYPDGEGFAGNAADIAELRVRPVGNDLEVRVTLQTLLDTSIPVIGIGVDTGSGIARAWPFAAGVTSVWDHFATVTGGDVWVSVADAPPVPAGSAIVDVEANTIELTIPGVGSHAAITLTAGAGLWDGTTGEWMAGSPQGVVPGTFRNGLVIGARVFDLAFNSRELEPRGGRWLENAQSRALTIGDVSAFGQTVDLDRVRSGVSDDPIVAPGFYNRIFRSQQDLGEGIRDAFPQYRSELQPYGLWIPEGFDPSRPTPLVLVLHSLSVHHNQYSGGDGATSYFTFNEQLGNGLGAILITPLGRGPDGWYENEGLVDTLEVWNDVVASYDIDPDRTYLTGYSMGGYGTYRLGTLFSDRFAGAVSWAGVPTDFERLENLHSLPIQIVHGTNDELVPVTGVQEQAARLRELGYTYRFNLHPGLDHFLFVWLDDWTRSVQWLGSRRRVEAPPTVHFRLRPSSWTSSSRSAADRGEILGHVEALGYDLRSSYWVRDVLVDDENALAEVIATSRAIADRVPSVTEYSSVQTGPPTPYLQEGAIRDHAGAPVENALDLGLDGIDAVTLDASGAGIDTTADVTVEVSAVDAASVLVAGTFPAGTSVVGAPGSVDDAGASFAIGAGTTTVMIDVP